MRSSLFTEVPRRGSLRTSPVGDSPKLAKNNVLNATKFIGDSSSLLIICGKQAVAACEKRSVPDGNVTATSNVAEGEDLVRAHRIYTRRTEARKLREEAAELAFLKEAPQELDVSLSRP
jgi:hypothetical protein